METWHTVALTFEKCGRAIYSSHLDMVRAWMRALRRAKLPIWYTEGFNPHPYISFTLPLPLMQAGLAEPVELRFAEPIDLPDLIARLNAVLPEGVTVTGANPNGFPTFSKADYTIALRFASPPEAKAFHVAAEQCLLQGGLTAKKIGKQGHKKVEKEILLDPFIYAILFSAIDAELTISATLAAGSQTNLNPQLLLDVLFAKFGEPLDWSITRNRAY